VNKGFLFMQAKWRECVLQKLAQADTGTPKHVSLYAGLVHAIESGRLKPGQKLPTETELADALPLSVGTIQRAMGSLVGDGLVLRRRGAGSFVAHPQKLLEHPLHCRFVGPQGFLPVYSELIGRKLIAARGPWSAPLQQSGKRILRIDRKLSINREFNVLSRIYVDALRFPLLMSCAPSDLASHNIKLLLAKHYRIGISHIEQSLHLLPFPAPVRRALDLRADGAGVRLDLLAIEPSGKAALFQELYVPSNPYRLVVSEKFDTSDWQTAEPPTRAARVTSKP
jgi:DNA-binding GntR family transcriptional regulator